MVNFGARFGVTRRIEAIAQMSNLLDTEYSTAAQLGPTGFTDAGTFIARPFPPVGGEFPIQHDAFLAPGAPRRAWAGVRIKL